MRRVILSAFSILSYPILSYPILSYLTLSYPTLPSESCNDTSLQIRPCCIIQYACSSTSPHLPEYFPGFDPLLDTYASASNATVLLRGAMVKLLSSSSSCRGDSNLVNVSLRHTIFCTIPQHKTTQMQQ